MSVFKLPPVDARFSHADQLGIGFLFLGAGLLQDGCAVRAAKQLGPSD
jgi:hypothetical protein